MLAHLQISNSNTTEEKFIIIFYEIDLCLSANLCYGLIINWSEYIFK